MPLPIRAMLHNSNHSCSVLLDTSPTRKLKLLVDGASDTSTRVKKLIAQKFRADNIFIPSHASDACVAL